MPSRDYGDLSRTALEADLDVDELPARLARMTARCSKFGRVAAYMCTPYANLGQPPRRPFVLQLEAARLGGLGSPPGGSRSALVYNRILKPFTGPKLTLTPQSDNSGLPFSSPSVSRVLFDRSRCVAAGWSGHSAAGVSDRALKIAPQGRHGREYGGNRAGRGFAQTHSYLLRGGRRFAPAAGSG